MAAPPDKILRSLVGKWKLNKDLSNDISSILAIQGTTTLIRKAIASASVNLTISQPRENEYHIKQTATSASIPGTTEQYILDSEWRTNKDAFFGEVRGRSKWISLDGAKDLEGVEGEWIDSDEGKLILAEGGKDDGSWEAMRVWGFEGVEGERKWVQRVKVWNKVGEKVQARMVYDFVGEEA